MADDAAPVDRLLTLGEVKFRAPWMEYRRFGLTAEHVPELLRLMTDRELNFGDVEGPALWGPVHAWRALAQLGAAEAAVPYLALMEECFEKHMDDLIGEDAPAFFAFLGPPALPVLAAALADRWRENYLRWVVAEALGRLSKQYPELRSQVVTLLTDRLRRAADEDPTVNGAVVGVLLDLKAAEAAPVIKEAFETDNVDLSIAGDWDWAEWELGLTDKEPARRRYAPLPFGELLDEPRSEQEEAARKKAKDKAKAKRKAAAKARKRNRKKR